VRATYDSSADAAYIYLKPTILPGEAKKTYACDPLLVDGQINLDFDSAGRLIGIEVLGATRRLPKELLDGAERIG
jgi:uncharacterized protein YuzE